MQVSLRFAISARYAKSSLLTLRPNYFQNSNDWIAGNVNMTSNRAQVLKIKSFYPWFVSWVSFKQISYCVSNVSKTFVLVQHNIMRRYKTKNKNTHKAPYKGGGCKLLNDVVSVSCWIYSITALVENKLCNLSYC